MPGSRVLSTEAEAGQRLQHFLSKSTPYVMGTTNFSGIEWLLLRVMTKETSPILSEEELSTHGWDGLVIHEKRWLFLRVDFAGRMKKSFAFDCTDSNQLEFLRDLLRNRRIAIGFRDGRAARLDPSPATSLVEDFENDLHFYIPDWKECYKQ